MVLPVLLALSLLWTPQAVRRRARRPGRPPQADGVAALVRALEKAAAAGDGAAIRALGSDDRRPRRTSPTPHLAGAIADRDQGARPHRRSRPDVSACCSKCSGSAASKDASARGSWTSPASAARRGSIAAIARLPHVTGLYRLALDGAKQYDVRDLTVEAPDLALHLKSGIRIRRRDPRRRHRHRPARIAGACASRRSWRRSATRSRSSAGREALDAPFDARVHPREAGGLRRPGFPPARWCRATCRRGTCSARRRSSTTTSDDAADRPLDLSPDRWSITPQPGDMIAESPDQESRQLTYTRSRNDAGGHHALRPAAPAQHLGLRVGREAGARAAASTAKTTSSTTTCSTTTSTSSSRRSARLIEGNARMKVKVRAAATTTLNLRLAEDARRQRRLLAGLRTAAPPARRRPERADRQPARRRCRMDPSCG